ncbi:MAG TPA: prepilin-type N-terminal cleavage/methylation domain-containing protein [Sedimentisphaerales bacterium]|nr:prepilin-type N-terminal cleavage/methylation domain-containing protein [Sedimentisphaerales bacterium]
MSIRAKYLREGFTLVELLVGLAVTSIVVTAVATLAYAVGAANRGTDDASQKQAQLRYATMRISELIRNCRLICGTADNDLVLWQADYNADGLINPSELVFLEAGQGRNYLELLEFPLEDNWPIPLSSILSGTAKQELLIICTQRRVVLVPECTNVQFLLDAMPPWTRFVSLSFALTEGGPSCRYQINAALRGWSGNLLGPDGDCIVGDDD